MVLCLRSYLIIDKSWFSEGSLYVEKTLPSICILSIVSMIYVTFGKLVINIICGY